MHDNFNYLLNTTNKDRYYEYFWLTFKNDILDYINEELKVILHEKSYKLNNLQSKKKYNDIYNEIGDFMNYNINIIIDNCIKYNNRYKSMHLIKNIKRWINLKNDFKYIIEYENYKLLSASRNTSKNYDYILGEYIKYLESNNMNYIDNIFIFSIKNKYMNIIDIFKKKVNLTNFIIKENDKPIDYLQNINSKKLYKYLQQ